MILSLRLALFALAFVFASLFGSTAEHFLLEVVRRLVPVEPSNAVAFNAVDIAVSAVPLLLFGAIGSASLSGEKVWTRRLWQTVGGLILALAAVRAYQAWWVLRGGIGLESEAASWTETLSSSQFYLLEKAAPFALLGLFSALPTVLFDEPNWKIISFSVLSTLVTFAWLVGVHKVPELNGMGAFFQALAWSFSASFLLSSAVLKIRTF